MPEVGLERDSGPWYHWEVAETCGIRASPPDVRDGPRWEVWTLSTLLFCLRQRVFSEHLRVMPPQRTTARLQPRVAATSVPNSPVRKNLLEVLEGAPRAGTQQTSFFVPSTEGRTSLGRNYPEHCFLTARKTNHQVTALFLPRPLHLIKFFGGDVLVIEETQCALHVSRRRSSGPLSHFPVPQDTPVLSLWSSGER